MVALVQHVALSKHLGRIIAENVGMSATVERLLTYTVYCNKQGAAAADGQVFAQFIEREGAVADRDFCGERPGTEIGLRQFHHPALLGVPHGIEIQIVLYRGYEVCG